MTGMTVFQSLQYVEDKLLEEAEEKQDRGQGQGTVLCLAKKEERTGKTESRPLSSLPRWVRWGGIAACLVLLIGAALVWPVPQLTRTYLSQPLTHGPEVYFSPQPSGYVNLPAVQTTVQPAGSAQGGIWPDPDYTAPPPGTEVGTPGDLGPYMEQPAEPEVFLWTEQLPASKTGDSVTGEVILVGQGLTQEQVAACAPENRLGWMEDFSGSATYKLADGSGGLLCVDLYVTHEELGSTCRITLLEATPSRLEAFGLDGERLPSWDGQGYSAFREYYDRGDGERVSILVAFEKEGVLYTLKTDAPAELEKYAAIDLRDLLLGYVGTHYAPDLGSFVYAPEG